MTKISLEETIKRAKIVNPNIKILEITYKLTGLNKDKNTKHLKCKCLIDGYEWEANANSVMSGVGCYKCAKRKESESRLTPIDTVRKEFTDRGYIPLFTEYTRNTDKLLAKTAEGYRILTSYVNFKQRETPCKFGKGNPYTIENIKIWLSINNKSIELLDDKYINNSTKLKMKCLIHNEIFYMDWSKIKDGSKCPICSRETISGENSKFWKNGITKISDYLRDRIVEWKIESFKNYDGRCDIENIRKRDNVIHHLIPFHKIVEESINILNLKI